MDTMDAQTTTLYDLLARHWSVGAPVTQIAFDAAGQGAAFATAGGHIALAPLADAEPPRDRYRRAADTGRATMMRRRRPVPPLVQVAVDTAPLHLAAFGSSGFIAGGRNGHLVHVAQSGAIEVLVDVDSGPIEAIVPASGTRALVAAGGLVVSYDPAGAAAHALCRSEGAVSALAVSPDGGSLAIAGTAGISVRACDAEARVTASFEVGPVSALAWSPDGAWLAAAVEAGGIALIRLDDGREFPIGDYPAPVQSLGWSADSRSIATSGAFRIIAWNAATLADGQPKPEAPVTGHAGLVPVETLAVHPCRPLVAAAYANGLVAVAQIGSRDELVVKAPGSAPARAMAWSRDGEHLALGCDDGEAAIVTFPPQLFK